MTAVPARRRAGGGRAGIAVCVETGTRRVFASALDWPGWARSGRTQDEALAALDDYRPRYRAALVSHGVPGPPDGPLVVTERLAGSATTDFGAPGAPAEAERAPLDAAGADRVVDILFAAWATFDAVAGAAPAALRKGPRGGGRDTAAIVTHLFDAEAAYARKVGLRARPPDPGDSAAVAAWRAAVSTAVADAMRSGPVATGWPGRYAARRIAWHALDHAWEVEDKSAPG